MSVGEEALRVGETQDPEERGFGAGLQNLGMVGDVVVEPGPVRPERRVYRIGRSEQFCLKPDTKVVARFYDICNRTDWPQWSDVVCQISFNPTSGTGQRWPSSRQAPQTSSGRRRNTSAMTP